MKTSLIVLFVAVLSLICILLNAEYFLEYESVVLPKSPDAVIITQRGLDSYGTIEALYAHPSLSLTPAFHNRRVIVMDGMAMIGFGPRTIYSAVKIASMLDEMAK